MSRVPWSTALPLLIAVALGGCRNHHEVEPREAALAGRSAPVGALVPAPPARTQPMKAIWVARMHYRYPDDIRTIMRNIADLGLNTVFWQVRGNGTVLYPSQHEPWSREYDYQDPGFDPLAVAVEAAHANGLRIEAWMNVLPGWQGPIPPPIPNQLWRTHPEWFIRDAAGRPQALTDFYVVLNPAYPEVRQHITTVAREIVSEYNVDGLHLDYVRYAWDSTPNAKQRFLRDQRTLALYRMETNRHPDDDLEAWDDWRAAQLTQLLESIRTATRQQRPGLSVTAAVVGDIARARQQFLQHGPTWLARGLVDALVPMTYTADTTTFVSRVQAYRQAAGGGRVIPGIGLYKLASEEPVCTQLRFCRSWGGELALFSYASLHPTAADREQLPLSSETQTAWLTRRAALQQCLLDRPQ